jgi:hypothetical protein
MATAKKETKETKAPAKKEAGKAAEKKPEKKPEKKAKVGATLLERLKAAAADINELIGPSTPIDVDADEDTLKEEIKGVYDELAVFDDKFADETIETLKEIGVEMKVDPDLEKKSKKEKKAGKEKKEKGEVNDAFGNRIGTKSAFINAMLVKGAKKADIQKALQKEFGGEERLAESKVKSHIRYLGNEGHTVTEKDGVVKATPKKD